jgi:predicted transcriptional regulator
MVRLEDKGWLSHREIDGAFLYSATISRENAQQRTLARMIETVFDGSAEDMVLTLLNGDVVSKSEADRIRDMIAKAKRRKS